MQNHFRNEGWLMYFTCARLLLDFYKTNFKRFMFQVIIKVFQKFLFQVNLDRGGCPLPPWLVSLNNSEMVKAVTLILWSIQYLFNKEIHTNSCITKSTQPPDSEQSLKRCNFDFWISGQSLINKNCHNSRTSHDTDMKI